MARMVIYVVSARGIGLLLTTADGIDSRAASGPRRGFDIDVLRALTPGEGERRWSRKASLQG